MAAGSWLDVVRLWLRAKLLPAWIDRDLNDEFQFHIDRQIEELTADGMSEDVARRAAFERFGNFATIKQQSRDSADEALRLAIDDWRTATMLPRRINLKVSIAALAMMGAIGGFVFGKMAPQMYQAQAMLEYVPAQIPVESQPTAASVAQKLEALQLSALSRSRMERLIKEFDLYPGSGSIAEEQVQDLRNHIDIEPGNHRTFVIRYTGTDATKVMRVTEKVAAFVKDAGAHQQARAAEDTISYLEAQIQEVGRRLTEHQNVARTKGLSDDRRTKLEAGVLEATYTRLLTSMEEARGRLNLERMQLADQIVLTEPARIPERPITLSALEAAGLGALAGLSTGIMFALAVVGIRIWRGRPPASPEPELAGR